MDVWIALVESGKPNEFRFLICDSRLPIGEYTQGNGFISNLIRKKTKFDNLKKILDHYRGNIEMEYKSFMLYNDDVAAEIV